MRKLAVLTVVAVAVMTVSAQQYVRPTLEELTEKLADYHGRSIEAMYDGRFEDALKILKQSNEWLAYLSENDPDYWTLHEDLAGNYYNMACCYSLLDDKAQALTALEQAYEYGWYDFRHMLVDDDLATLRGMERFEEIVEIMRLKGDYLLILRDAAGYRNEDSAEYPALEYEWPENYRIRSVRSYFDLDSVAGKGDELSRIINIMTFVHNNIPHDGGFRPVCEYSAIDLYNYCKANDNKGMNCRMLAIALNDCYLAMGFKSRFVTCLPQDRNDGDCHVINSVWSDSLSKWIWMDASFNAYVTDEDGILLGIAEVRERMRDGRSYFLNEDANRNNRTPQTKEHYLDEYMAKNLYWMEMPAYSHMCVESPYFNSRTKYICLVPEGYIPYDDEDENWIVTSDADYFWQAPDSGGDAE